MNARTLRHELGHSIALTEPTHRDERWVYVYGGAPKPYFHPLRTPRGVCVTMFEPYDHVWHRGLWFTFKYINGENFWEERDATFGTQVTTRPPDVRHLDREAIRVDSVQRWVRPDKSGHVFEETRRFTYRPIDELAYAIDFETKLVATADLVLDRTPFTTWGGYGGLTFRGTRNWQKSRLLFSDGSTSDRPTPVHADFVDLSGELDGGNKLKGGVAMFDHPNNPRSPTPWYGATGVGHYFNAALLFHEPMSLAAGETLALRYRVIVHDDVWELPRLQAAQADWLGGGDDA